MIRRYSRGISRLSTGAPERQPRPSIDLLVGEHGLVDRIPVDERVLAVGDAFLEHLQEQPLVPAVVLGLAGRQFARPVEGEAPAARICAFISAMLCVVQVAGAFCSIAAFSAGRPKASQPIGMSTL